MDLKRSLISIALSAAMFAPAAALADDRYDRSDRYDRNEHHHSNSCGHMPAPPPGSSQGDGRYEIRTVSQWVEGRYVREWVPEQCVTKEKRHGWRHRVKTVCSPGYYTDRWIDGHYENVEQWVWVPARRPGFRVSMRF